MTDDLSWTLRKLQYPNRADIMFLMYILATTDTQVSVIIDNPDKIGIEVHSSKNFIYTLSYLASYNYISKEAFDNVLVFIDEKCMFAHYKISYNKGIIESIKLYLVYA